MAPAKKAKPAPEKVGDGPRKFDQAGHQITTKNTTDTNTAQPFIDKHGHRHTEAVLRHWSPAVLKAMGVRRIKPEHRAQRPTLPRPSDHRHELNWGRAR